MKYSLQILKNKYFQETQISFPKCIEYQIFLETQLQLLLLLLLLLLLFYFFLGRGGGCWVALFVDKYNVRDGCIFNFCDYLTNMKTNFSLSHSCKPI